MEGTGKSLYTNGKDHRDTNGDVLAMFMKPSQPHPEVEAEKPTKTVNQHSHSQTKFSLRKVRRIPRPDMKAGLGCDRAQEDELKVRRILKIYRKAAEEGLVGTLHVADALVAGPSCTKAPCSRARGRMYGLWVLHRELGV